MLVADGEAGYTSDCSSFQEEVEHVSERRFNINYFVGKVSLVLGKVYIQEVTIPVYSWLSMSCFSHFFLLLNIPYENLL